ncbi:hypothetical protein GCM10010404_88540 [Nonomuraea africana]
MLHSDTWPGTDRRGNPACRHLATGAPPAAVRRGAAARGAIAATSPRAPSPPRTASSTPPERCATGRRPTAPATYTTPSTAPIPLRRGRAYRDLDRVPSAMTSRADTAAALLITAGDNPDRLASEAAFAAL